MKGVTTQGAVTRGQVKIKEVPGRRTATVRDKVGAKFASKSWKVTRKRAWWMLDRIDTDSLRGLSNLFVQIPRYNFRMLGQLSEVTPDTLAGINCANCSQMMLCEAGITDQGGLLIDFPRTQALPGSRSNWMTGFLAGLGLVAYGVYDWPLSPPVFGLVNRGRLL
jgi:hypothetical protein